MHTKYFLPLLIVGLALGSYSAAQQIVNQGKPGTQGPWPVTGTIIIVASDAGTGAPTVPAKCAATQSDGGSVQRVTSVGTSSTQVPATGASDATRYYLTVCNSSENTGTPLVKCLYNNVAPVMGVVNPGDVLGVSDCWQFPIAGSNQLRCISDTAATAVTSNECIPVP